MKFRTTVLSSLLAGLVLVGGCSAEDSAETPAVPAGTTPTGPCDGLELTPGSSLAGPELGGCVMNRVMAAGSGRMASHYEGWSALLDATAEFTTTPEFAVSAEFYDGAAGAILIGDQAWVNDTMGWVSADPAGDLRQINASQIASVLRTTADPQNNTDFISMSQAWEVTGPADVTLPDGSVVTGTGVAAVGDSDLDGTRVSESTVVLDEQFRPLSSRAASSQGGATVFTTLTYFDWGTPITITAPV